MLGERDMAKAKRMIVFGVDSISMRVMDQVFERGYCPTMRKVVEDGCYAQGRSFCPVETGTNWPVLATGASPSITGCNMSQWLPGMALNSSTKGFPSELCQAEQIWNAAARAGKRSLIFDYPQSYPVNCDSAIHIGEDGRPGQGIKALSENCGWVTDGRHSGANPNMWLHRADPRPAEGWANLPETTPAPIEVELVVKPGGCSQYKTVSSFYALLLPDGGSDYAKVAFYAERDGAICLGETTVGQWSEPLTINFSTDLGDVEAWTRTKVFSLAPDGSTVHIYASQIYPVHGFVHPASLEEKLLEVCGPYYPHTTRQQTIMSGACDVHTFKEEVKFTTDWYKAALSVIAETDDWDLFIQKWHPPDFCYHFGAYMIDPGHPLHDPDRLDEGWGFWGEVMNMGDELLAHAMKLAGEDTIVAIMSDHGGKMVLPGGGGHGGGGLSDAMVEAGLTVMNDAGRIDWAKSRAIARGHYGFVNLKGRDPDGIVEPGEEYEEVRDAIIKTLLSATDANGRHLANLVCRREDAAMIGVGGERVGDVFIWSAEGPQPTMTREEFESAHPGVPLGTWEWPRHNSGDHRPDPYMIMGGPGLKKGVRRDRSTWINTFAPTLALAWGIPVPKDADGGAIWEFLDDE